MINIVKGDRAITYTEEKSFTPQQAADLFLSVRWVVGKYPDRLYKALMNSSRVISAWDGDRLIGLIRVMDDSELVCFINYVLVHPDYRGQGIAGHLLEIVKDAYKSYLYINHLNFFRLETSDYLIQYSMKRNINESNRK